MALVSVIMPAYNCAAFVADAIESVLAQTFKDWELEIVDDCSTDNTHEVLGPFLNKYPNIHYTCMNKNSGPAAARTEGIKQATGQFVAFLDSDDAWHHDKLKTQIDLQRATNVDLIYTGAQCMSNQGDLMDRYFRVPEETDYSSLLKGNDIVCSSVLVKREVIAKYPMHRSDLHEDFICWLSILKAGHSAMGINSPLVFYRLTENSKSRSKMKSAKMTYGVYKYMDVPFFQRCVAFLSYTLHGVMRYYKK